MLQVRKFLKRREMIRKEPPAWQKAEGLTDERRVYLQKVILDRREANPVTLYSCMRKILFGYKLMVECHGCRLWIVKF